MGPGILGSPLSTSLALLLKPRLEREMSQNRNVLGLERWVFVKYLFSDRKHLPRMAGGRQIAASLIFISEEGHLSSLIGDF